MAEKPVFKTHTHPGGDDANRLQQWRGVAGRRYDEVRREGPCARAVRRRGLGGVS